MAAQQVVAPARKGPIDFDDLKEKYSTWLKQQPPAVECLIAGVTASIQGVAIGFMIGNFSKMDLGPEAPGAPPNPFKTMPMQGGPWAQARNLGVLMGCQAGLSLAIKKARNGQEDVWGAMGASFGSGVAYSLVSGAPNPLQAALTTGCGFAIFNGLFFQVAKMFAPDPLVESEYDRAKSLLLSLGLPKYADNLKKGQLNDSTIMLWNDSALKEVRIPAGPRLLILHHLEAVRNPASVLKPGLPVPYLPPRPPLPQQVPQARLQQAPQPQYQAVQGQRR